MVGLCACAALFIVGLDGGDGDIVKRRAKAISGLIISCHGRWGVVADCGAVSFI